ncbi:MAG: hypothetical protein EAZ55_01935 [Cytophagales bacterium]|nr:MAG: hypothetical protein EAZ55_01935 [Cytophagales bacterium]
MQSFSLFKRPLSGFFILVLLAFNACKQPDNAPPITGTVLVTNEGNFSQGNGEVSLLNPQTREIANAAYTARNGGLPGGLVQSLTIHNGKAYIAVGSSNNTNDKIEIVEANNLQKITSVTSNATSKIIIPRYAAVANNKLYVSNWGNYDASFNSPNSFIAVIDLSNNTLIKNISVGSRPEGIVVVQDKIYVANQKANTVSIINPSTDAVETTINTPKNPTQIVVDTENNLWVMCNDGNGKLIKIDTKTNTLAIEQTYALSTFSTNGKIGISPDKKKIYFVASEAFPSKKTNIYSVDITNFIPANPVLFLSAESIYGLGIDPNDGSVYVGFAPSFSGAGTVKRYQADATEVSTHTAGIAPNGFAFLNQ